MKHINEDPLQFFEEGGWEFLLPESDVLFKFFFFFFLL